MNWWGGHGEDNQAVVVLIDMSNEWHMVCENRNLKWQPQDPDSIESTSANDVT